MQVAENTRSRSASVATQGAAFTVLLLYFFFEYVRPQSYNLLPMIQPLRIPMFLTIALLFIFLGSSKKMVKDRLVVYVSIFIFLIGFSVTYAPNTYHVWGVFKDLLIILVCVIMVMPEICNTRERLMKFFYIWVFYNFLLALYAITHGGHGPGAFLWDENDNALALNMCVALPFYFMLRRKSAGSKASGRSGRAAMDAPAGRVRAEALRGGGRKTAGLGKDSGDIKNRRLFMLVATVVLVVASGSTMSRGGFLGLVGAFGMIWLLSERKFKSLAIVVLTVAIAGYPVYKLIPERFTKEMSTIFVDSGDDSTREDRFEFWGYGWDMFLDNPILGVGAQNFPWTVPYYQMRRPDYNPNRVTLYGGRPAHSLYFTLIPELGSAGIIVFLLILKQIFGRLRRIIRVAGEHESLHDFVLLAKALLVSTVAYLVTGAFISVLYYPPFWYLIGFVLTLEQVANAEIGRVASEGTHAPKGDSHNRDRRAGRGGEYPGTNRKRSA